MNREYHFDLMKFFRSHLTDEPSQKWFKTGFEYISDDLGKQYAELLHQYILFEASHHWVNPSQGLKKKRHPALSHWMAKSKRKPAAALTIIAALSTIESVRDFAEHLWTWWCELQPGWREISNNRPAPFIKFVDNFLLLDKHGQNGWLGLIVCIKWWRLGLNNLDENGLQELEADWFRAVEDMTKMLIGIVGARRSLMTAT